MSSFATKMCRALGIRQNASTVFHPRTDGQSECTNQKLEQFLCFYSNAKQEIGRISYRSPNLPLTHGAMKAQRSPYLKS